jgi:hypothetical protein
MQQEEIAREATKLGRDAPPEVPAQVEDPKWQHAEEAELGSEARSGNTPVWWRPRKSMVSLLLHGRQSSANGVQTALRPLLQHRRPGRYPGGGAAEGSRAAVSASERGRRSVEGESGGHRGRCGACEPRAVAGG